MKQRILIIDDDTNFSEDLKLLLSKDFDIITSETIKQGVEQLRKKSPDLILLDLMLKNGENGLSAIGLIKTEDPNVPIIMITDHSSVDTAIKAIKKGAFDYISKTTKISELRMLILKAIENKYLLLRSKSLKDEVEKPFKNLIGDATVMQKLKEQMKLFADNNSTLLIYGETGTGKELVTRQIHKISARYNKPFIAVNCAAIPKELLESELFGHEKGSFTGASYRKPGRFELAGDGTLFLDEIAELDMKAQVALLRVLQEKEYTRVGGHNLIKTNARVIAATNRKLEDLVKKGLFREDLFYRLDVLRIDVPPLRERKDDIPLLARHFIQLTSEEAKIPVKKIDDNSLQLLTQYDWPGNVRELYNFVMRTVILSQQKEKITFHLESNKKNNTGVTISLRNKELSSWADMIEMRKMAADTASRKVEKYFIQKILKKYNNNISMAAKSLGIDRTTLHKVLKKINETPEKLL